MKAQLSHAGQQLRAEQRALATRRAAERRLEQEVPRKATEQAATEREQARQFRAAWAEYLSRRRVPRSEYEASVDEGRAPRPPVTRADLHTTHDQIAARVVSAGGGIEDVIEATDLRTLSNVAGLDLSPFGGSATRDFGPARGRAAVSGGADASYPGQRSRSAISSRLPAGSLK